MTFCDKKKWLYFIFNSLFVDSVVIYPDVNIRQTRFIFRFEKSSDKLGTLLPPDSPNDPIYIDFVEGHVVVPCISSGYI